MSSQTFTLGATGPDGPPAARATEGSETSVLADRYEDRGAIASGSTGDVRRVWDRRLERMAAIKVLRWECADRPAVVRRFHAEIRLTADLQHPGVVAVHDQGVLPDGRPWFVMQEVRGRTFSEVIREARAGGSGLRRLVVSLLRVCETVAYAHSRGVLHRDLKPLNIMVGPFGEVLVMDWGLGRRIDGTREPAIDGPDPAGAGGDSAETRLGEILGTPAYMAPEQARGEPVGTPADVYALGTILYEILTGRPPWTGTARAVWQQVVAGPPPDPTTLQEDLPDELVGLCRRAMERDPARRVADAGVLVAEIEAWLDGARRRNEALALLDQARRMKPEIAEIEERAAALAERAAQLGAGLRPTDPVERKRPVWAMEDAAAELRQTAALREVAWLQTLQAALRFAPDLADGHAALATHYHARTVEAEAAGDRLAATRYEALLRAHDRGRHAAFLEGGGHVSLRTEPPGAMVHVYRFVLQDRRLEPESLTRLGVTPLDASPLRNGSYILRLSAPGRAPAFYPVEVPRGGHWDGVPAGEAAPRPIPLFERSALGPDDLYVPAGWCRVGDDPEAAGAGPARRVWVGGFVMRRNPVTRGEYAIFLQDLAETGVDRAPFVPRGSEAEDPDLPVVSIPASAAEAYAAWVAVRTGRPWRLPTELEREKAARGVDGRRFPWGDHPEPTWACNLHSQPAGAGPCPVYAFAEDTSPYGIHGLAGNVRDWCADPWTDDASGDRSLRVVRGGAWSDLPGRGRAAARFAAPAHAALDTVGFRLVWGVEG